MKFDLQMHSKKDHNLLQQDQKLYGGVGGAFKANHTVAKRSNKFFCYEDESSISFNENVEESVKYNEDAIGVIL